MQMSRQSEVVRNRYDIVQLFDVQNGNPNGDPDQDNMPRVDPDGYGYLSDGCMKRQCRDYMSLLGMEIYFTNGSVLNAAIDAAVDSVPKSVKDRSQAARDILLKKYADLRLFGGVLSTGKNAGQVTGPVHCNIARSVDRVHVVTMTITRKSVTTEEEAKEQLNKNGQIIGTMGRKHIIPYAMYKAVWTVDPSAAQVTGMTNGDLAVFLKSLNEMWEHSRSSTRGLMTTQAVFVFEHNCTNGRPFSLGSGWKTNECRRRVRCEKKNGVNFPHDITDYDISVDTSGSPKDLKVYNLTAGEGSHLLE